MQKSRSTTALFALAAFSCMLVGCAGSNLASHIRVDGVQQTAQLRAGQNAVVHYLLDNGERRYKYCFIHSVNDKWLTVYDKEVKASDSVERSGWLTLIPIDNILLIRVEQPLD